MQRIQAAFYASEPAMQHTATPVEYYIGLIPDNTDKNHRNIIALGTFVI